MRRSLPFLVLIVGAVVFWIFRPGQVRLTGSPEGDRASAICQGNLRRIGLAFAQYAEDWDGKFPRGIDAEDQVTGSFRGMPMLHIVLHSYLRDASVWHCPADIGWKE